MKLSFVFLYLLFQLAGGGEVHKVARINKIKSSAEKSFKEGNYKEALENYTILTDSFDVKEESVIINKAHCFFKLKKMEQAKKVYSELVNATDNSIRSIANNQLGLIAYQAKNPDMAKNYFKASLKAFPQNGEARYNYELMARLSDKDESQQDQNKEDKNQKSFEPSAFAKKLKAQAESLSGSYKYQEAYNLMMDGVKKDKSVLYYKDFIDRLKVVADLAKL